MRRALLAGVLALALAGCESTQDKAAKLQSEGGTLVEQEGLTLKRSNADVEVVDTAVITDEYGTAVVAELRNTTGRAMVRVPVGIDVLGADGASVFRNDAGGIEESLTSAALLPSDRTVPWVNNQIVATGKAKRVEVKVGKPEAAAPSDPPEIATSDVELREDVDGPFLHGVVENRSKIPQKRLTIYAVARKGDEVVAAGRAVIDRLEPHPTPKPVRFSIYFIGDPRGAELDVFVPPVNLS